MNFKRVFIGVLLLSFMVVFEYMFFGMGEKKLPIVAVEINGKKLILEVAFDRDAKERGLQYRRGLRYNRGMIFPYEKEKTLRFWMKNTYIPLDIAFVSKEGLINEIYHMKPLSVEIYKSIYKAKYAIEVNRGWFVENGVKIGDKVTNLCEVERYV